MADAKLHYFLLSWENHLFNYCAVCTSLCSDWNWKTSAGSLF